MKILSNLSKDNFLKHIKPFPSLFEMIHEILKCNMT